MMVVLAVLFIGLKGVEISGIDLTKCFWRKTDHDGPNRAIKTHNNERKDSNYLVTNVLETTSMNGMISTLPSFLVILSSIWVIHFAKDDNIVIVRKG